MQCSPHSSSASSQPTMTFDGLACGAPAVCLIDSGATHAFIDSTFAPERGIAWLPASTYIQLADGSVQSAKLTCHVHIKLQGPGCTLPCFVIDTQQQFDLISGDTRLQKVQLCSTTSIARAHSGSRAAPLCCAHVSLLTLGRVPASCSPGEAQHSWGVC